MAAPFRVGGLARQRLASGARYMQPPHPVAENVDLVQDRLYALPFWIPDDHTISEVWVEVRSAAEGVSLRAGLYAPTLDSCDPATLLAQGEPVSAATTGAKRLMQTPVFVPQGLVWATVVAQGGVCTVMGARGPAPFVLPLSAATAVGTTPIAGMRMDGVSDILPAAFTVGSHVAFVPRAGLRVLA